MRKPYRLLKKISDSLAHIKKEKIQNYSRYNLYCQDESRIGLLTMNHRALTIQGVKPVCKYQHKFESLYLFGAFSPINGNHLLLEMPHCNTDNFQIFLNEFSLMDKEEFKIILLDNGAFHKAKRLTIPDNISLIFIPPYSPELNPAEKVWWVLKRGLKNKFFSKINDLMKAISKESKKLSKESIKQLTSYQYYEKAFMDNF